MADHKEPVISKTGIYFDSKSGEVVEKAPEEGVQIVPPGGEVDAGAQADIARYKGDAPVVTAVGVEPDPAPDDDPEPKKAAAAKKSAK